MYRDTVTLFCRYKDGQTGATMWHSVILPGVDLNEDRASIVAAYGEQAQDRAILHIKTLPPGCETRVGELVYKWPKEYTGEPGTFSLKSGNDFDFFIAGCHGTCEDTAENDYLDGFFDHMNATHDRVYKVSNAAVFSVIPHIEVTGR